MRPPPKHPAPSTKQAPCLALALALALQEEHAALDKEHEDVQRQIAQLKSASQGSLPGTSPASPAARQ